MVTMSLLHHGKPPDRVLRDSAGRRWAQRKLWLALPALTLAFVVWLLWSVVVVYLPVAGFNFSSNQLFWLAALPALSGATLRLVCIFAAPFVVPSVGGQRFTVLATASLLLPAWGIGLAVQDPSTSFEWMVMLALLCGLGGGNFASSRAHTKQLFPPPHPGQAPVLLTGLAPLGMALVQGVVPLVMGVELFGPMAGNAQPTAHGAMWLQNAGFVWVPCIAASAIAAWCGRDDVQVAPAAFADQAVIFTHKHSWLMCWLSLGSWGSLVGLSAGMPLLMQSQFQRTDLLPLVWLGPLAGVLLRPLGGWLAGRWGGGRTTLWSFVLMALGAALVWQCLPVAAEQHGPLTGLLPGFLVGCGLLFAASGLGLGSSFQMIPTIFVTQRQRAAPPLASAQSQAAAAGHMEAAAVAGLASALGVLGGFFIPKSYGTAIALTGSPAAALQLFILFYLSCVVLTWWHYGRRHADMRC
jgi:MFS transporter, NNP family, nitrate/nitrite transporter